MEFTRLKTCTMCTIRTEHMTLNTDTLSISPQGSWKCQPAASFWCSSSGQARKVSAIGVVGGEETSVSRRKQWNHRTLLRSLRSGSVGPLLVLCRHRTCTKMSKGGNLWRDWCDLFFPLILQLSLYLINRKMRNMDVLRNMDDFLCEKKFLFWCDSYFLL